MDPLTIGIGSLAVAYGVYTAILRAKNPSKLGKLQAMKKMWGDKTGTVMHVVAYTLLPILLGVVLIIRGSQSGSLF